VRLHHLNLTSMDPQAMWDFYVTKLGVPDDPDHWVPDPTALLENRFCKSGDVEFHLSRIRPDMSARFCQPINPLQTGHIAFLVDDLEATLGRLARLGVSYADYGTELGGHWWQAFVIDPRGGVVELRQKVDEDRPAQRSQAVATLATMSGRSARTS
jgi:catechol 2,3-dioxygenase-like lactoylglutathione lyase family enzyme